MRSWNSARFYSMIPAEVLSVSHDICPEELAMRFRPALAFVFFGLALLAASRPCSAGNVTVTLDGQADDTWAAFQVSAPVSKNTGNNEGSDTFIHGSDEKKKPPTVAVRGPIPGAFANGFTTSFSQQVIAVKSNGGTQIPMIQEGRGTAVSYEPGRPVFPKVTLTLKKSAAGSPADDWYKAATSGDNARKDLTITLEAAGGKRIRTYTLFGCLPVMYGVKGGAEELQLSVERIEVSGEERAGLLKWYRASVTGQDARWKADVQGKGGRFFHGGQCFLTRMSFPSLDSRRQGPVPENFQFNCPSGKWGKDK
jgi:hypothetical protein